MESDVEVESEFSWLNGSGRGPMFPSVWSSEPNRVQVDGALRSNCTFCVPRSLGNLGDAR